MGATSTNRAPLLTVDGAALTGSGAIVRQAAMFAALTGRGVHLVNARHRRPNPGLRPQHLTAVTAIRDLVGGSADGLEVGSRELTFVPGDRRPSGTYAWDIGSAGSATALSLALLPVVALTSEAQVTVEVRGGLFQDGAPSYHHLAHVLLPLVRQLGVVAHAELLRPGYVPRGWGAIRLTVEPAAHLSAVVQDRQGALRRIWGVALSSHLSRRRVSQRMADAARERLGAIGVPVEIDEVDDISAVQAGAALALFADLDGGVRLGSDGAGAPGRPAEAIGRDVAARLLEDLAAGSTVDRFATDQIVPFAALAEGVTRLRVPAVTGHLETSAWLAELFVGARVRISDGLLEITGAGHRGVHG